MSFPAVFWLDTVFFQGLLNGGGREKRSRTCSYPDIRNKWIFYKIAFFENPVQGQGREYRIVAAVVYLNDGVIIVLGKEGLCVRSHCASRFGKER